MENQEITEPKKRILSKRTSDISKRKAKEAEKVKLAKKKAKQKEKERKSKLPYEYKGKFLPYHRAKKVVKVLQLQSRADYIKWYNKYKPDYLPARPDNSYEKEFEGWVLFLSKPPKSILTKRMQEEKRIAQERKQKEKARDKETKKLKEGIHAAVRYEMRLAQKRADSLKRREGIASTNYKKEKKQINKRLETPVKTFVPKRPRRKVESKYLPYAEARALIAPENFASIKEYTAWWEVNKPAGVPKRPDRVYKDFKWTAYLNKEIDDRFKKKDYRSMYLTYEEARRYARQLGIENAKQWDDFCKAGKNPKNIPRYPHLIYQYRKDDPEWGKWFSWEDWLGNLNDRIEAIKERWRVMMLIKPEDTPHGVYSFVYMTGTENELNKFIDDNELYVIRMYKVEIFDWSGYLHRRFQPYAETTHMFQIQNINQVLFDFDQYMERVL